MDTKLYKWNSAEEQKQDQIISQESFDNNIIKEEQIPGDIGLNSGEAGGLSEKRQLVSQNMPEGIGIFAGRQSLIMNGRYRYLDKSGREHDAARTTPSSKYMKPVLTSLKAVDDLLAKPLGEATMDQVRNGFLKAILACENYLDNRSPWSREGKARKQMVRDFYAQLKQESLLMENKIAQMNESREKPGPEFTWLDVLKDVRSENYSDKDEGVKISSSGGNTSDVLVLEKNGKKKFFKKKEQLPSADFTDLMDESLAKLGEMKNMTEQSKKRAKVLKKFKEAVASLFRYNNEAILSFLRDFNKGDGALDALRYSNTKYADDFIRLLEDCDSEDMEYFSKEIEEVRRFLLTATIAKNSVKIDANDELTKRNVATSRLASILGLDKIVAKSEMANVTVNGKKMTGILMEEAEGKTAYEQMEDNYKAHTKLKYSSKSFKDLMSIQVFDLLCGQTDRHVKNYMGEIKEKNGVKWFSGFKAIDNDMSFGTVSYNEIQNNGMHGWAGIKNIEVGGQMILPFIDQELADNIMALEPSVIEFQMVDILSKKERKALTDRIIGVKKAIAGQRKKEADLKKAGKTFESKFVDSKNDEKAWNKAFRSYKEKVKGMVEKNPEDAKEYVEKTTYLHAVYL